MPKKCYTIERYAQKSPIIYFEFDLAYGSSPAQVPPGEADYKLDGENITTHRKKKDRFRLEMDGNRIEIKTKEFELTNSGRAEMVKTMRIILKLVDKMKHKCRNTNPISNLNYPPEIGKPRAFRPTALPPHHQIEPTVKWIFPIQLIGDDPYYRNGWSVPAALQATFELPLAKIDKLVSEIKNSEKEMVAGKALSAPPGWRQGKRSQALYDAQLSVNSSRLHHIKNKTSLGNGKVVTTANFSPTLQGLLILMVSYLRASLLPYNYSNPSKERDYEQYAKGYLPLNVKNSFRLLFHDLTPMEKTVFKRLYYTHTPLQGEPWKKLWEIAKRSGDTQEARGDNILFPEGPQGNVHVHQGHWFSDLPTWSDFAESTVENVPWLRTNDDKNYGKKGEDLGCEVLFAPLSRMLPYEKGSRRVAIEMRRLSFNWIWPHGNTDKKNRWHPGWLQITKRLFNLAKRLNK